MSKRRLLCFALLIWVSLFAVFVAAGAEPPCYVPIDVVEVKDGDTIVADICLPWGVTLRGQTIRCSDYDAWESSRRRQAVTVTDAEVVKGKRAAIALSDLLDGGDVYLSPDDEERDNYGRILGRLAVVRDERMVSVADFMREAGHVRK